MVELRGIGRGLDPRLHQVLHEGSLRLHLVVHYRRIAVIRSNPVWMKTLSVLVILTLLHLIVIALVTLNPR